MINDSQKLKTDIIKWHWQIFSVTNIGEYWCMNGFEQRGITDTKVSFYPGISQPVNREWL